MTTTKLAITALLLVGCASHHLHPDHVALEQAQEDAQACNYIMKVAPRSCDLDHSGERTKGAIKSWSTGETIGNAEMNANFTHIHTNMVGGHGGRLTDIDVSASAN